MNKYILKAVQAIDGGISSRRLAGMNVLRAIIILAGAGGAYFLYKNEGDHFIQLVEILCWFCAALLGITTMDYFSKKK